MVGMASGCFTRSAGVGGAQQGFKISESERAEINPVTKGDRAGKPRRAVFAFAHFHEAKVEDDFWRGDFAERDGGQRVALPDATGEKVFRDFVHRRFPPAASGWKGELCRGVRR